MSRLQQQHEQLDETGKGKCSVPMWCNGLDAGFCDKPAFGKPLPYETFRDPYSGRLRRTDGGFAGYVPALACPNHGGPPQPIIWTCDQCNAEFFGEGVADKHSCQRGEK